jgi:hypothetical protein
MIWEYPDIPTALVSRMVYQTIRDGINSISPSGLCRGNITDQALSRCGSFNLDLPYIQSHDSCSFILIGISEVKLFTKEECHLCAHCVTNDLEWTEWEPRYVLLINLNHIKLPREEHI